MLQKSYFTRENPSHAVTLHYCGWESCGSDHTFGPATRAQYLFHYIRKGKGRYFASDHCYELHAGQGFLICPGQSTIYQADHDDPWEYGWFAFTGYEAQSILSSCGLSETQLIFNDRSGGLLEENLTKLSDLFDQAQISEYAVLGQFYNIIAQMQEKRPTQTKAFDQSYSDKAVDFIYHNFSYDIKIGDIAKYIGIDRTYLYKIFTQENKLSPQQYLIQFRLNVACSLLEKTEMNITEICYSCGFKDTPSFYKHFKRHYAQTPVQYRTNPRHNSQENKQSGDASFPFASSKTDL